MKKVLFVINTLGGAGAEKALLELLKKFTPDQYETSLYVLMDQEADPPASEVCQVLNKSYQDASVLSRSGKKILNKNILKRLFIKGAVFQKFSYLIKAVYTMEKKRKIYPDKLLWRVMSDSGSS